MGEVRVRIGRAAVVGLLVATGLITAGAAPSAADGNEAPGSPAAYEQLSAGGFHTCAILEGGQVKCWGANGFGQLGLGDSDDRGDGAGEMGGALPSVDLGAGRTATAVSAGDLHTCALLDNGTVKCWGINTNGQLGQGHSDSTVGDGPSQMGDNLPAVALGTGRTATAITAGNAFTCALLDNGTVKCWGQNSNGQLGQGHGDTIGDGPGEMGDNLPAVALGTGRTATAVTAGAGHACALLDDSTVKCWGLNESGQLGLGNTTDRGDNGGEMGDSLPAVALGTGRTATAVSSGGRSHTCALLDDSTVRCWGLNAHGQLGLGDTANRGDGGGEMGDSLPAVALGTGRTATGVSAGGDLVSGGQTCARLDDNSVKCWGAGGDGRLGQGDTANRGDGGGEMGDSLPAVALGTGRTATAVTTGNRHTCARLDDNSVKCWGNNGDGQLGQGDTANRGDGAGEMGDALPAVPLAGGPPPPTCDGQPVTVNLNLAETPTAGPDVILGTAGPDAISALGGDDRICAGGGVDTVNAGGGDDRVFGQAGADHLTGSYGNDRLDGGDQNDDLFGNDGADTLFGRTGADDVTGDAGHDALTGGAGNDRLFGQAGDDDLKGETGNDTLDGGNNNDALVGGPNTDNCNGRAGVDTQTGCEVRAGIP